MKKIKLSRIRNKLIKPTWANLKLMWEECRRCPLHKTRANVVFGNGPRDADVILIGEAPGQTEDETGEPFVGKIGKMLDRILEVCKVDRKKLYVCNTIGCRPPNNRAPQLPEKKACFQRLKMEIELVNPRFIIFCGNHAAYLPSLCEEYNDFFAQFTTFGMFHPGSIRHHGPEWRDTIEKQVIAWAKAIKKKGVKLW